MKQECQHLFKKKSLKKIFKIDVDWEIIIAHKCSTHPAEHSITRTVWSKAFKGYKKNKYFAHKYAISSGGRELNIRRNWESITRLRSMLRKNGSVAHWCRSVYSNVTRQDDLTEATRVYEKTFKSQWNIRILNTSGN